MADQMHAGVTGQMARENRGPATCRLGSHRWPVEGLSLSLPYVQGRLVIEVSGPAGSTGQLADSGDDREIVSGRLGLVRDTASSRPARTEVAGG
jgi:hypothetical protein